MRSAHCTRFCRHLLSPRSRRRVQYSQWWRAPVPHQGRPRARPLASSLQSMALAARALPGTLETPIMVLICAAHAHTNRMGVLQVC